MKKLLLSVIAFALILTSCYKKDFKNVNTRLDTQSAQLTALAAQVQGVATLAAGITTLQTNLAALQASVNTIGGNVTALQTGLTSLTTAVGTISTNLTALAAAVAAGNTTTQGMITTLNTLVTNNQTAALAAIAGVNTSLTTAINNAVTNINSTTAAAITAAQTALNTAIANAQSNINANTAAEVAAAQAALNTAITNAISNINGNTNSQVSAAITALQTAITNAQTNINANTTAEVAAAQAALSTLIGNNLAAIVALGAQLTAATTTLNNAITAAQTAIINNDNANFNVIKAIVDALTVNLAIANAQIQTLLSSNNVFIGDLIINDEATLTAAEALGAKVRVITGNVNINTTGLSAVDPDGGGPLLSQMVRLGRVTDGPTLGGAPPPDRIFIGTVSGTVTVAGNKAVDLGSLVNVSGAGGHVTLSGANHDLSALLAATGNYSVTGSDVMDDALVSVGGNMTLNYPAAYGYPNLTTIGGTLTTTDGASVTSISFPVLASVTSIDGNNPVWAWATSVLLNRGGANIVSLTANNAGTITLNQLVYNVSFSLLGNLAQTVTMGATNMGGSLTVTVGSAVGGVNPVSTISIASLVATAGTITITTDASTNSTVSLTAYNDNDNIVINGPTVQTLPAYTGASGGLVSSGSIITLTLPVYRAVTSVGTQFDGLTVMQNLTVGNAKDDITTASFSGDAAAALRNLTVTASDYVVNIGLVAMANLQTVSTAGLLQSLFLQNNASLTSVTTAGNMDFLSMINCDALTSVTVGHNYYANVLGQGTNILLNDCDALATFSTGTITGALKSLDIRENNLLANLSFPNFVAGENITAGVVNMQIYNNKISGTYTNSVFATNSAPIIAIPGLASIKAYALNILGSGAHAGSWIDFGFYDGVPGGGGPWDNSITTLDNDATAFNLAGALPNPSLLSFIQRIGDNNGQGGNQVLLSRINVARELGYVQ